MNGRKMCTGDPTGVSLQVLNVKQTHPIAVEFMQFRVGTTDYVKLSKYD